MFFGNKTVFSKRIGDLIMDQSDSTGGALGSTSDGRVLKMKKVVVGKDIFGYFKNVRFCDVTLKADDGHRWRR